MWADAQSTNDKGDKAYYAGDYAEALKWYRKAAEQGHAKAQVNLGVMYRGGIGVTQDNAEAVKWYRKSAEQGNAKAQVNLGYMYRKGKGVTQDDVEAVKWYRKSAEQGDATAQVNLGLMYDNGRGVTQDDVEAVKWYRKAAPDHWNFKTYNTSSAQTIYDVLGADKQTFIRVPHRANRAVLFDNRLFHETDRFDFGPGFANRRINITMLFGKGP